jgi:hypothetical protein
MPAVRDARGRFIKGGGTVKAGGVATRQIVGKTPTGRATRGGGRRNFGVTIDDDRWEDFVKKALEVGSIELRVGILRAGNKYPPGWVGTKSREKDRMSRFAALASGERARTMLAAYRENKRKANFAGYGRKARRKAVDVAKVAAVVGYEAGKRPKLPGMWLKSIERLDQEIHNSVESAMKESLAGRSGVKQIERLGARLKMAYKADVLRSGHVDTRRLLNAINWEVVDVAAQQFARRINAARRRARKIQRELAKGAR